jgi:hypothetical protein
MPLTKTMEIKWMSMNGRVKVQEKYFINDIRKVD